MTEIPAIRALPDELTAAVYLTVADGCGEEFEEALTAILAANERRVREQVATLLEGSAMTYQAGAEDAHRARDLRGREVLNLLASTMRTAARIARGPQGAPTVPAQPAEPREKHCGELLNHPAHPYRRLGEDRTCPGGSSASALSGGGPR